MNIQLHDDTLRISGMKELAAANAQALVEQVCATWPSRLHAIEIDLSETGYVDSCGVGALVSLLKTARNHNGGVSIRLLHPTRPVEQIFELTRLHRVFEIEKH